MNDPLNTLGLTKITTELVMEATALARAAKNTGPYAQVSL
jgi:hypothetical protein